MCNWTMIFALFTLLVSIDVTTAGIIDTKVSENVFTEPRSTDNICLTPACIHSASTILRNMNSSVNPCDDFYEFACGNFVKSAIIPNNRLTISTAEQVKIDVIARLQGIIDDIDELNAPKHFRLVKIYYNNCLKNSSKWKNDESNIESAIQEIEKRNGWPLRSGRVWKETNFGYHFTFDALFGFSYAPNITNSSSISLQLNEREPPLPRTFLKEGLSNEVVQAYCQYMIDIAVALNITESEARRDLVETLRLETELYQNVFSRHNYHNLYDRYAETTIGELATMYPYIPFAELSYKRDTIVQIALDEETMDRVNKWIARKSKRALANWEAWRFIANEVYYFGDDFAHRLLSFQQIYQGMALRETKLEQCVLNTQKDLGFALSALYQREFISKSSVNDLTVMLENIRNIFSEFIEKAEWMNAETKRNAVEKVSNIKSSIATCGEFIPDAELEKFYRDLELSEGSFEETSGNVTKFMERNNGHLTHPLNETGWTKCGKMLMNTGYTFQYNFIQIGAEIYANFFHDIDRPKYLNYGAAGETIAHEMSHSLSVNGRQYDKNGNLKPWWDSKSNSRFVKRIQCLVDQYNNYSIDEFDVHVDGLSSLDENIADNEGLKLANHAYINWASENGPEKLLPGLDYSPRQMFWLAMASAKCQRYRMQRLKYNSYLDVHSPNKFRVNGPMSNLQNFADDFNCDPGTRMNPVKKCNVF